MFEISVVLSERFKALEPIKVRKYPFHEVILLIKRLNNYDSKQDYSQNNERVNVIYKPASDDWY